MTQEERQQLIEENTKRRFALMTAKNKEYMGGSQDANYNFKEVASRLGTRLAGTPEYVCLVYLYKHILSLEHWAKTGEISSGESIRSRLDDIRNYLDILETLLNEKNET